VDGMSFSPQAVVMCGGRASRLGPLADSMPKALQPVAGRPFLDWLLELLLASGIDRFHFCLGHLGPQIRRHLAAYGDRVHITWHEEAGARGTAGALRESVPFLDEVFVLVMGDTYLGVDYRDIVAHLPATADALMVVTTAPSDVLPNVEVVDRRVVRYDKAGVAAHWTDTGVAVLRRRVVADLPRGDGPLDLARLFTGMIQREGLAALPIAEEFYDIGTPGRLRHFESYAGSVSQGGSW
jgi:NDP-sugar pyrophosphorylase family protein